MNGFFGFTSLFLMECKKTGGSVVYWFFVIALLANCVRNYDTVVESELSRADEPTSVFYTAEDGIYAENTDLSDEEVQQAMMIGATKRLLNDYRNNSYEYYPFGYVKEKTLSEKEQSIIRTYLQELTGLHEPLINGSSDNEEARDKDTENKDIGNKDEENNDEEAFQISGGGAFVLKPGQGTMQENGQFVADPGDWEYVEKGSVEEKSRNAEPVEKECVEKESVEKQSMEGSLAENEYAHLGSYGRSENEFEIQVTFQRFKEIMNRVNALIGRNSYYSWTMLAMYYCENDMQDTPITERQHREFYEKDHVTGAFARYFCDSISLVVLVLPAFVMMDLMLKDKRHKVRAFLYTRKVSSAKIICARFTAAICMVMLPILLLPLKSLVTLISYCGKAGISTDVFAFAVYTFAWVFPTVLSVAAVALFVTVLTGNHSAVLVSGLIFLFGKPSIDKIAGGNYGVFDLVIRHNTLKGYGRMMENIQLLIWNRVLISVAAIALVAFTVMTYEAKRKGGVVFGFSKSADDYKSKYSHEL